MPKKHNGTYTGSKHSPTNIHGAREIERIEAENRRKARQREEEKRRQEQESGQGVLNFKKKMKKINPEQETRVNVTRVIQIRKIALGKNFQQAENKQRIRIVINDPTYNDILAHCESMLS